MNRVSSNLVMLENWKHNVMPLPRKRIDKEVLMSGQWLPTWSMAEIWQVHHPYNRLQFVVDLGKKNMFMLFLEVVGIPCRHVVSSMQYQSLNIELYVDASYMREAYQSIRMV